MDVGRRKCAAIALKCQLTNFLFIVMFSSLRFVSVLLWLTLRHHVCIFATVYLLILYNFNVLYLYNLTWAGCKTGLSNPRASGRAGVDPCTTSVPTPPLPRGWTHLSYIPVPVKFLFLPLLSKM